MFIRVLGVLLMAIPTLARAVPAPPKYYACDHGTLGLGGTAKCSAFKGYRGSKFEIFTWDYNGHIYKGDIGTIDSETGVYSAPKSMSCDYQHGCPSFSVFVRATVTDSNGAGSFGQRSLPEIKIVGPALYVNTSVNVNVEGRQCSCNLGDTDKSPAGQSIVIEARSCECNLGN